MSGRSTGERDLGGRRDWSLLRRFLPLLRAQCLPLLLSVLLMLSQAGFDLAVPWVTRGAVDRYIVPAISRVPARAGDRVCSETALPGSLSGAGSGGASAPLLPVRATVAVSAPASLVLPRPPAARLQGVRQAGFLLLLLALARFFCSLAQVLIMELAGQRMMHQLRLQVYAHIQKLPLAFFTRNPVGRLATRVTNDIQNMQEMFTTILTFALKDLLTIIGIVAVLVAMDPALAAALLLIGPPLALTVIIFSRKSREVFRLIRVQTAEINSRFSECVSGIRVIQLFNREAEVIADFKKLNHENYLAGVRQIVLFGMFMPMIDIMSSAALAIVIYYGGGRVLSSSVSLGTLIAFISYSKMFFRPLRDIAEKHNILQNSLSSGERLIEILDLSPESAGGPIRPGRIESLRFEQVDFSYLPEEPLLKDISFSLGRGEALAIVGPTGSGKTSLINLIARFYEPDRGRILVNDQPLAAIATGALRERIAIVSQEPYLFSGSLRENLFPGAAPDPDKVERVIRAAHLGAFLAKLPAGLDSHISQGGASLSSGERQLLSLARAFAREPDLIIFDEATSYVDTEAEEKIRLAIAALRENRASITIAHRLRSAMTADCILVLIDGRIAEAGSHAELMASRGFYYRSVKQS